MKPILFNTEMVRAILEGRKTVTRRVIKPNQLIGLLPDRCPNKLPEEFIKEKPLLFKPYCDMSDKELISSIYKSPYEVGDVLYIRETWHKYIKRVGKAETCHLQEFYGYKASIANSEDAKEKWKPSIHMPKAAARIFLRVTSVRAERLRDMTEVDAIKEGSVDDAEYGVGATALQNFKTIWNSTIRPDQFKYYGWNTNPYVWVIEFERVDKPEAV